MSCPIDLKFDFYSDIPPGRDPDSHSPTLRKYHKILWNKSLPSGDFFTLVDSNPEAYLYHKSRLGEFKLNSDAITHSYRDTKKMSHIIKQVPAEKVESLFSYGSTIGGYIVFPKNRTKKMSINQARGVNYKIKDRFDLTLECIRLFYGNFENPLTPVLKLHADFFRLFLDFKGYVDFFLLQDLVEADYSAIKHHLPHRSFDDYPLPKNKDEYLTYRENTINFFRARGQRMLDSVSDS